MFRINQLQMNRGNGLYNANGLSIPEFFVSKKKDPLVGTGLVLLLTISNVESHDKPIGAGDRAWKRTHKKFKKKR